MRRKRTQAESGDATRREVLPETERGKIDHGPGLVGAAVLAPLSQGRNGSFPLTLEGDDLAEPHTPPEVRGEPTEPVLHAPTTTHIEPRPVATGECTVETLEGVPLCEDEEE